MGKLVLVDPRKGARPHILAKVTKGGFFVAHWPLCSTAVHRAKVGEGEGWKVEPVNPPSAADAAYCRACREKLP